MAFFHLQITSVGRSAGRRATAAAAYRAGERVRDERTGKVDDYRHRTDVLHTEIFLPAHLEGAARAWAGNREMLWNAAEHAEKKSNSRVAREYLVALPEEFTPGQRVALARSFAREIAERYRVAVDLAVHTPRPGSDPRNFHAHLLTTTREVTPTGLGAKTGLDRHEPSWQRAIADLRREFLSLRERWATLTNQALREAGFKAAVEHRSLASRGIDRVPRPSIPIWALKMEERGVRSEVADRLRRQYCERLQRYNERVAGRAAAAKSPTPTPDASPRPGSERAAAAGAPRDFEQVRHKAREAWLRSRTEEADKAAAPPRAAETATAHDPGGEHREREASVPTRGVEDDLAL